MESKKTQKIAKERQAYEVAASQKSFLDPELKALNPCPYDFYFDWTDAQGKKHKATCDDWETAATLYRREKIMGTKNALESLKTTFGEEYPKKGMVFAMGTHSRRPEQWLLVGVLRLNKLLQPSLL